MELKVKFLNINYFFVVGVCWYIPLRNSSSSLTSGSGKTAPDLEGVVDDPLEAGEGTDHEDSCSKTFPESGESDFRVDFLNLSSSACT